METLIKDLRWGLRTLRNHPGFSAIVVLTLALGIGANTAIFSVVNAVLLQPLPYHDPERLVRVWSAYPERGIEKGSTSPLDLDDWYEQNDVFEEMGGFPALRLSGFVLTGAEVPEEIPTSFVTEGFFETLGVPALHGRTITRFDHVEGKNVVVVVSHGAFQRRFGGDPAIVGDTLSLRDQPFTVIGVMPPSFEYPYTDTELWAPLSLIPDTGVPRRRFIRWLRVIARLKPEVSIEQARAEMTIIAERLAQEYPDSNERLTAVTIRPLHDEMVGDVQPAMLTIFGAVGFVLLIGCANIANLVLARAEGRGKEIAIRAALGAGGWRLIRQLLTESVMLSLIGGLVGFVISIWGVGVLVAMAPEGIPLLSTVRIDGFVLAFTGSLAVLTGLFFGAVPAMRVAGSDLHGFLKEGVRGSSFGGGRRGIRGALVVGEVALVVVLAIAAGLLIRSYSRLLEVDPGLDPANLLTLGVTAQTYKYPERPDYTGFFRDSLNRLREVPGVESVGMIRPFPLRADTFEGEDLSFTIAGRPEPQEGQEPTAAMRFTGPGYFRTVRIPLLSGRDFTEQDNAEAPIVVIINRTAAERYWAEEDPVGESILFGDTAVEIIGVVSSIRQLSLSEDPTPAFYVNYNQIARVGMTYVVRTTGDPVSMIGAIQRAIWEVDPDQPIKQIATMERVISDSVAQPRFSMTLLAAFAALALALATVGVYGVISYTVTEQTHEIGIRLALGAESGDVLRLVVRRAMLLAGLGVAIGLMGAFAATRLMTTLLFQVTALDPLTFFGVSALLVAVALTASLIPALRASRVDPIIALRSE